MNLLKNKNYSKTSKIKKGLLLLALCTVSLSGVGFSSWVFVYNTSSSVNITVSAGDVISNSSGITSRADSTTNLNYKAFSLNKDYGVVDSNGAFTYVSDLTLEFYFTLNKEIAQSSGYYEESGSNYSFYLASKLTQTGGTYSFIENVTEAVTNCYYGFSSFTNSTTSKVDKTNKTISNTGVASYTSTSSSYALTVKYIVKINTDSTNYAAIYNDASNIKFSCEIGFGK